MPPALALVQHFSGVSKLLGIQLRLAPEWHAAFAGRRSLFQPVGRIQPSKPRFLRN